MDEATKERLRNHWISRALRAAREDYIAHRDHPMFLIMDAACLAVPLFQDEPYFQRPTPLKQVGGVIRFAQGSKTDKVLITNLFLPKAQEIRRITVCSVAELVDGLGGLINDIGCDSREAEELLDKVRRWITHDDTQDDVPDKVSWAAGLKARASIS